MLDNPVKRTLRELDRAIEEIDRQLANPPASPLSFTEQISILRFLRNQCMMYYNDLIGNDLTEEQKLELCKRLGEWIYDR
jgi:uncharacterized Fe-S cluster-containing radical SAM superfamily protein